MKHGQRPVDQVWECIPLGKTIPHHGKVFSIFEEHIGSIRKGKTRIPQELGLRVRILEDQYGFILRHRAMEKETDDADKEIEDSAGLF